MNVRPGGQLEHDLHVVLPVLRDRGEVGLTPTEFAYLIAVSVGERLEPRHRARGSRLARRLGARRLAERRPGRDEPWRITPAGLADDAAAQALVDDWERIPEAAPGDPAPPPRRPSPAPEVDPKIRAMWQTYVDHRALASPEEREELRAYLCVEGIDDWRYWLPEMFPGTFTVPFAPFHADLWGWVMGLTREERADPFIAAWARGAAKSANAEASVVVLGARRVIRYCLYVSGVQDLADSHVENIAALLESPTIGTYFPDLGDRAVTKFGAVRGWRRNRLVTASGLVVDALGLDSRLRGLRFEEQRPDYIVLDDIDDEQDGPGHVAKKIELITKKLLPAGDNVSPGGTKVLGAQNLIHPESVFSRLVSEGGPDDPEPAEFLRPRIVSGPIPAVRGLVVEEGPDGEGWEIVDGEPTWPEGQSIADCQAFIRTWGLPSFMSEAQHEEPDLSGGMFTHLPYRTFTIEPDDLPADSFTGGTYRPGFSHVIAVVDPAVSKTDRSDACGVQIDARGADGLIYRLHSWERRATPLEALTYAIRWGVHWGAETLVIETDQGGDTWESVYREAITQCRKEGIFDDPHCPVPTEKRPGPHPSDPGRRREIPTVPRFRAEKAGSTSASKQERAARMLVAYDVRDFRHLAGYTRPLDRALRRFPRYKPFDLVDAAYWGWHVLEELAGRRPVTRFEVRRPKHRSHHHRPTAAGMTG